MTQDEVCQRIKEDIAKITGLPVSGIGDEASFQQDLGLDSLSLLELVVHLEYGFRIKVPEHELAGLRSVADTTRYVHERVSAGA
jgi:acyl carrier protein